MTRTIVDSLRAAADRVEQLPDHLPDPGFDITADHVHARWREATEHQGRKILEALPGDWRTSDSFMYRSDDGPVTMWWVYFAQVVPVSTVNPAALLAEATA